MKLSARSSFVFVWATIFSCNVFGSLHSEHHHDLARSVNSRQAANCVAAEPVNTISTRINTLLANGGAGTIVSLCPSTTYPLNDTLLFVAVNQEISTMGYPTGDTRAILIANRTGMDTVIQGQCANCGGAKVRNVQVDGNKGTQKADLTGTALLELGGNNTGGHLIEHSRLSNPLGTAALHITEGGGPFCKNATIQFNDIGPVGTNTEPADGITVSCAQSLVTGNTIANCTDGAITFFGGAGTTISNNVISVGQQSLTAAIKLVDFNVALWDGDMTGTTVENNTIAGPFATGPPVNSTDVAGPNSFGSFLKIGIAGGPKLWGGINDTAKNRGAIIKNNNFLGAMGFAIGLSGVQNWTVQGNTVDPKATFNAVFPQGCDANITDTAFIYELDTTVQSTVQAEFVAVPQASGVLCLQAPPTGLDKWPQPELLPSNIGGSSNTPSGSAAPSGSSSPPLKTNSGAGKLEIFGRGGFAGSLVGGVLLGIIVTICN